MLLSCTESVEDSVRTVKWSDFGEPQQLKGKVFEVDSIWNPIYVYCSDSVLFLIENSQDYFVSTVDIPSHRLLTHNVRLGNGPGESLSCFELQITDNEVVMLDAMTKTIKKYPVDSFINYSDVLPSKELSFEMLPYWFVQTTKNEVVTFMIPGYEETLLSKFESLGHRIDTRIDYPKLVNGLSDLDKKFYYKNKLYFNSFQKKIVLPYMYTDLVDIYDEDLNLLHRVQGPDCFKPILFDNGNAFVPTEETMMAYQVCGLTSDKIWLLYLGISSDEDDEGDGLYNKILVFDYDGTPLHYYELEIPVSWLCVNEANHKIFGISDCPERSIVEFEY